MDADTTLAWWQTARPFFIEHSPNAVAQLDNDAQRLQRLLTRSDEIVVCVLGHAAVGKSTLLNAVVAGSQTILPAGGIGPLTALATQVRYSAEPYFNVVYENARRFQGFRLALEAELRRQGRSLAIEGMQDQGPAIEPNPLAALETDLTPQLVPEPGGIPEAPDAIASDDERRAAGERQTRIDEVAKLVRQIVKGDQFASADLAELVVGLRLVLGLPSPGLPPLAAADLERVQRAAAALRSGRDGAPIRFTSAELGRDFAKVLREHATGALTPLIQTIEVGWPSDVLADGLVLVDLPGVGIADDSYRTETTRYIRQRARAVILVVDRAGPTDASVELIRDTGYWDRLLLSSSDPESDACALLLAVSKLDDVAREEYRQTEHLDSGERPKLREVFARLRAEAETRMRAQAASCFSRLSQAQTEDEAVRTARVEAGDVLLGSLGVFPVSATQYRELIAQDDEVRPFVREADETGLPALQAHLKELARRDRADLVRQREEVAARLVRTASATLDQTRVQWSENLRAVEEAVRLREALDRFLEPKRLEFATRQGAFREFLDNTATIRIEELVARAQSAAQEEVARYLLSLSALHWATLRATVTRGGTFVSSAGRRVDLAADVAQRFQEPMAAVWGQTLLKDVRTRTQQHGRALEEIVAEICAWADAHADTQVQQAVLHAQQALIRDRVRQLGQVGREAVDELKDAIKRELVEQIAPPIRHACEEFVRRGNAYGPGVRHRILTLIQELANLSVRSAAKPAARLLKGRFSDVRGDVLTALAAWGDPIQQAADAVAEREEMRQRRSDAQRRARVLEELDALRLTVPPAA